MCRKTLCGIVLIGWVSVAFGQSLVPKEAIFKGKFVGRDLKVDGELEGTIAVDFSAEVTEDGIVKGTIEATDITIAGIVEGNILAVGSLTCAPTAEVRGVIQCRDLTVETGAIVSGTASMGETKTIGTGGEKKKEVTPAKGRQRRSRRSRR